MNEKSSPALLIFLITLLLTAVLVIMVLAIEPTLAGPMRQAGDPLPPAVESYAIGFDDAPAVTDNWQDKLGVWTLDEEQSPGQYVQSSVDELAAISIYRRGIEDEYSVEVSLQHLDGDIGGLFFNAPDPGEPTVADAIRYNRIAGEVEWGQINAGGSFLTVGSTTNGIPSDDEFHTLKVVVAGDQFTAFFDDVAVETSNFTRKSLAYVGVYTANGSYAFRAMSVKVTAAPTATPTEDLTPTPLPGDLDPSDQTYNLGFNVPASINNWLPDAASWSYAQGYVQSDQSGVNRFSFYQGRVNGDYEFEVTLSYLSGEMGGGALFNASSNNSLAGAMLAAFNPDSASGNGAIVQWGYFDNNSAFQFLGDHLAIPPAADGGERRLRIQVANGNYSIWLNDAPLTLDKPFIAGTQTINPYVGLYTSQSSVRFGSADIKVSQYVAPTATPTPSPTISPTPTVQPTPTARPTRDEEALEPQTDPYIIGFEDKAWTSVRVSSGWKFTDDGYRSYDPLLSPPVPDAMSLYDKPIRGDYEYEISFKYIPPEDGDDVDGLADAGLVFNAPVVDYIEAYYVTFSTNNGTLTGETMVQWGYFEEGSEEDDNSLKQNQIGETTVQRSILDGELRKLKVKVARNEFSLWLDDSLISNANQVTFADKGSDEGRVYEPTLGVFADRTRILFVEARVEVTEYVGEPTPTFTPTTIGLATATQTPTATPYQSRTPTPTPTWTPGTPSPTPTSVAISVLPTPTTAAIIIAGPPLPTPLPTFVISTPTTKPATQTAIAAAVIAATATDSAATATALFDQGATATTMALSATQTAAVIPNSPSASPTATLLTDVGATNTVEANATIAAAQTVTVSANATITADAQTTSMSATATGTTSAVAQAPMPTSAATETAAAQTAVAQSIVTTTIIAGQPVVVVVATPTPTQRPVEESPQTPAEPVAPAIVTFWAQIMNAIVNSAAITWVGVGLAVFIGIAAVLAGIAFQPEEESESPYDLHDDLDGVGVAGDEALDEAEFDRILDNLEEEIGAARAADAAGMDSPHDHDQDGAKSDDEESRRDSNQGDNWPTSLP